MSDFPPPPGILIKGTVHKKIERLVNGNQKALETLLTALKDPTQDYVEILKKLAGVTQEEADYLCKTWYGSQCWWPAHHPMEPIVRQSLIKALELASDRRLPVNSYWLCAGDQFQVIVTCDNLQVIRLILTPPPEGIPSQPIDRDRVWIFKKDTGV